MRLHLIFRLGGELFAIPIDQVREVVPFSAPVAVPRAPDFVKGVVNHHGRVVVLVDLRRFLSVRVGNQEPPRHLILLAREDMNLGIACETVARIAPFEPPRGEPMVWTEEGLVLVLDLDEALGGLESYFG